MNNTQNSANEAKIVALAGGVGGAKLALGLYLHLQAQGQAEKLTIIGNVGDDLELFGVRICPDLDTVMYTLAGVVNKQNGWGVEGDTQTTLNMLKRYGEDTWFSLGDYDFATHLIRTKMLHEGHTLTQTTAHLARGLGLECALLPVCNEDVRTFVQTQEMGEIPFQEYFVKRRAQDTVTGLRFAGIQQANITPEVKKAIEEASLIIFGPSNPYLSLQPILQVPGMRDCLKAAKAPKVAVSPIVGGKALKGPAAAIMQSFGGELESSALGVAKLYADLISGFVLDKIDVEQAVSVAALGLKPLITQTIMSNEQDKKVLAAQILQEFLPE
jgi:LPPG:FO 2-phospho-L-lactate transferase